MNQKNIKQQIPLSKTIAVLIGFPVIASSVSLLLLKRSVITDLGFDFINTFWAIIIGWYILQIFVISRVIHSSGWSWADIGFSLSKKNDILSDRWLFSVCIWFAGFC